MFFSHKIHILQILYYFVKKLPFLIVVCLLILCFCYPSVCAKLAAQGLVQWYRQIIPVLLPFMILTSLLRYLDLDHFLGSKLFLLRILYPHISVMGHFVMLLGFLCGFPMGAKIIRDYYKQEQITKKEAQYLLCFCNNISPAFFIGIVWPVIKTFSSGLHHVSTFSIAPFLLAMYGIPLVYGWILQYFFLTSPEKTSPLTPKEKVPKKETDFALALDYALYDNILPIVKIGGYLMIFQIVNIFPLLLFPQTNDEFSIFFKAIISCTLEITNGILAFAQCMNIPIHILIGFLFFFLQFGGISCILQTNTFLIDTDLSLSHYIFHKTILGVIAGILVGGTVWFCAF